MIRSFNSVSTAVCLVVLEICALSPAFALEEIIVTARKRAEAASAIPIQVTSFSNEAIGEHRLFDLDDYVDLTPTLQRIRNGNDTETLLIIRGLGNYGAGESSVGFFVDGTYRAAGSFATSHVFDMERIEILHGPQGALYGKSTTGGAVNLITNKPKQESEARLNISAATDAQYRVDGAFGGSLGSNTVAGRLAFSYEDFDGHFKNATRRQPLDENRQIGLRASLLWEPTNNLSFLPVLFFRDQKQLGFSARRVSGPRDYRGEVFQRNQANNFTADAAGGILTAEYSAEKFDVVSITAYNTNNEFFEVDLDYTAAPTFYGDRTSDTRDYSQEIRIRSNGEHKLDWQFGFYHYYLDKEFSQRLFFGGPQGSPFIDIGSGLTASTSSVFFQGEFSVTEKLKLNTGIRYDYDIRKQTIPTLKRRVSFNNFSGDIKLQWFMSPEIQFYASVSRMFRPGGFNEGGLPDFDEEKATVYEMGIKSAPRDWLNVSAAVFNNRLKNSQNLDIDFQTFAEATANKGNAEILGFEARMIAQPHPSLTIDLSGSWLDHEYDNYVAFRFGPLGPAQFDFSGNDLQWIADYQAVYKIHYEKPISLMADNWKAHVVFSGSFVGPLAWDDFNTSFSKTRNILDLSAGISKHSLKLEVFVDNLLDQDYFTNFVSGFRFPFAGGDLGAPSQPRQVGISLSLRY